MSHSNSHAVIEREPSRNGGAVCGAGVRPVARSLRASTVQPSRVFATASDAANAEEFILGLHRQLRDANSLPELFATVSEAARCSCGFTTAVVLKVQPTALTADLLPALSDPSSDRLRRQILQQPLPLIGGSAELDFIRSAEGGRAASGSARSILNTRYGLTQATLSTIMPDERALALIVGDRDEPEVTGLDRARLRILGSVAGLATERIVLRQRTSDLHSEIQYMINSARALVRETIESPLTLTSTLAGAAVFPPTDGCELVPQITARDLLTRREWTIAKEMVTGKSNRAIAETLHLSHETVKSYVSLVLRKLGATNRGEAIARLMRCDDFA
jgi:DNA-binding CsgD family transcriptional regulator/uncharacterized protein YigA (DUF484 family)